MSDTRNAAKLAAKRKLVQDLREEVTKHQNAWQNTGDRMHLHRYKAARTELRKAQKRYDRFHDKLIRKGRA